MGNQMIFPPHTPSPHKQIISEILDRNYMIFFTCAHGFSPQLLAKKYP
jgi:hypothetical protein